jgi:predicted dehydrogenase
LRAFLFAGRPRRGSDACLTEGVQGLRIGHTGRGWYGHGLDMAFQKIPTVTVVGVADPNEKGRARAARRTGAARAYADD